MRTLTLPLTLAALSTLMVGQTKWETATQLNGIDMAGLNPAQTKTLLSVLRSQDCVCGCPMKLAQCRVEDPACGVSLKLSRAALKAVREGKNEQEVRAIIMEAGKPKLLEDPVKITIDGDPSKGPDKARITLVEFSDFQCPYCAVAVKNVNTLLRMFPNDIRLVFKQYPLTSHPQAKISAEASLAAQAQGKFWEMHDKMYANYRSLSRDNLIAWAKELGMDVPRFTADLDSHKYAARVQAEYREGNEFGIPGTPTFFINGQRYNGSLDPDRVKPVIEAELSRK